MGIFLKTELWLKHRKHLFVAIFLLIFISGFSYIYFLNLAVYKMAERNNNLNQISEIKRAIQGMETDYINTIHELDYSYAKTLGLIETEPVKFIYRQKPMAQNDNYGEVFR